MSHHAPHRLLPILCLALVLALAGTSQASAQCTVTRSQVEADVAAGLTPDEIALKYAGCTASTANPTGATGAAKAEPQEDAPAPAPNATAPTSLILTNTGSTFYEAIRSCGYHPQREELACTIEVRQRFGFGGPICNAPGSHEFIHFCVDYGAGLVPVHINGFHIHDEMFNIGPNWYFSAVVQSDWRLLSLPNNGRTLKARAILAWNQVLGGGANYCNLAPIWGNQADFRIRLDP
jgi:hypothetical protein